jgi:hypothetical protein
VSSLDDRQITVLFATSDVAHEQLHLLGQIGSVVVRVGSVTRQ